MTFTYRLEWSQLSGFPIHSRVVGSIDSQTLDSQPPCQKLAAFHRHLQRTTGSKINQNERKTENTTKLTTPSAQHALLKTIERPISTVLGWCPEFHRIFPKGEHRETYNNNETTTTNTHEKYKPTLNSNSNFSQSTWWN